MTKPMFDPDWFKVSDCVADIVPAGTLPFVTTSMDFGTSGEAVCTQVLGFYDPVTGEIHIQEVVDNLLTTTVSLQSGFTKENGKG